MIVTEGDREALGIACGRVWPPDTASSDTCECGIMWRAPTFWQQRQDKEMRQCASARTLH